MKTFKRICIKDYSIEEDNRKLNLVRGKEYTTSESNNGMVTVFTTYWAKVPVNIFASEIIFTK